MPLSATLSKWFEPASAPPKGQRAERGQFGEKQAEKALKKTGLKVIAKNWRSGHDEIDLVCQDGACLVFVEVRTRDESCLTPGIHSLTSRKRKALKRVCQAYLKALRQRPSHIRFDLVEISLCQDGDFHLHHHQNIPLFS